MNTLAARIPIAARIASAALLLPLLAAPFAAPLAAQWAPAPRIAPHSAYAAHTTAPLDRADFLAAPERARDLARDTEQAAPAIRGQLFAGFAGLIVGATVGVTAGVMMAMGSDKGSEFETVAIATALGGLLGGTTYGVHRFSRAKGGNGKALSTFGGATLGLLGGPLMLVTVPLGARWAYNRSRTDGVTPAVP